MKKSFLLLMVTLFSIFGFAQTTWKADPMHSSINFSIKHMGISFVQGRFNKFNGTLQENGDGLAGAKINFVIDAASINTDVEPRDNHLRNADFFDVAKYPNISFTTTSVQKLSGNNYKINGMLTMKDVTRPVSFAATYGGKTKADEKGLVRMGLTGKLTINRFDYNINFDPTGMGVGKDVDITVFMEFTNK